MIKVRRLVYFKAFIMLLLIPEGFSFSFVCLFYQQMLLYKETFKND